MTGAKNRNSPSSAKLGEPSTSADQEINAEAFLNVADRYGKPSRMPFERTAAARRRAALRLLVARLRGES